MHQLMMATRLSLFLILALLTTMTTAVAQPLANGDFAKGTAAWSLDLHQNAKALLQTVPASGPDGQTALKIQIQQLGNEHWNIQLVNYTDIKAIPGRIVDLSFLAKAENQTNIAIFIQESGGSWSRVTNTIGADIYTNWNRVTARLKFEKQVPKTRLLITNLGHSVQSIYIADAKLKEVASSNSNDAMESVENGDAAAMAARARAAARVEKKGSYAQVWPFPAQTIKGWGGHIIGNEYWDKARDIREFPHAVKTFYEMGFTFVRANAHWDAQWDESGQPSKAYIYLRDRIKLAQQYGVKDYILACWSGPREFRTNNQTNGFKDLNKNRRYDPGETLGLLPEDKEDGFVAWYIKLIKALEADGLGLPLNVSVANEPDQLVWYENTLMSPTQWARVTIKMRKALDNASLQTVGLIGPDTNYSEMISPHWQIIDGVVHENKNIKESDKPFDGYLGGLGFSALKNNPELDKALSAYGWHSYSQCNLPFVAQSVALNPKDCWMTENSDCGGNDDFTWAMFQVRHFLSDMVDIPNNYWTHWAKTEPKDLPDKWALLTYNDQGQVQKSKRYHVFKRLWNTVHPGWKVHHIRTNDPYLRGNGTGQDDCWVNVDLVAFVTPSADRSMIVAVNPTSDSRTLIFTGLTGSKATTYCTSKEQNDHLLNETNIHNGQVQLTLPARSICLIETNP